MLKTFFLTLLLSFHLQANYGSTDDPEAQQALNPRASSSLQNSEKFYDPSPQLKRNGEVKDGFQIENLPYARDPNRPSSFGASLYGLGLTLSQVCSEALMYTRRILSYGICCPLALAFDCIYVGVTRCSGHYNL